MLHLHDRLPIQLAGILEDVDRGFRGAVENDVEEEIFPEPLGGSVFVGGQPHLAGLGAAFDLDEPHFDGGGRVFGMRFAGNEIEPAIVLLDAFNFPAPCFFVGNDGLDGSPFHFIVLHHRCDLR